MKILFAFILALFGTTANAVTAEAYILMNANGEVLLQKNADDVRPIASITKLVTTLAASSQDRHELIEIQPEDVRAGRMRSTPLRAGRSYPRELLIELALVSSDNVAALALARTSSLNVSLPSTLHVVEGSGLSAENVSSARGIAELARSMIGSDLARVSVQPNVTIGPVTRRSTNPLINRDGWSFHLSKTGFTNPAGGCLVAVFETSAGPITAVILGSRNVPARWRDLVELRQTMNPSEQFANVVSKPVTKRKPRNK